MIYKTSSDLMAALKNPDGDVSVQDIKDSISQHQLDVTYIDPKTGNNFLHIAVISKRWETLDYLLSLNKIKTNARNNENYSLIDYIIFHGTPKNLHALLAKYKLDITSAPEGCLTPLQYSVQLGRIDLVEYLIRTQQLDVTYIDPETRDNLLHTAVEYQQFRMLVFLFEKNPSLITTKNEAGDSPFIFLIKTCLQENPIPSEELKNVIKICIAKGLDVAEQKTAYDLLEKYPDIQYACFTLVEQTILELFRSHKELLIAFLSGTYSCLPDDEITVPTDKIEEPQTLRGNEILIHFFDNLLCPLSEQPFLQPISTELLYFRGLYRSPKDSEQNRMLFGFEESHFEQNEFEKIANLMDKTLQLYNYALFQDIKPKFGNTQTKEKIQATKRKPMTDFFKPEKSEKNSSVLGKRSHEEKVENPGKKLKK